MYISDLYNIVKEYSMSVKKSLFREKNWWTTEIRLFPYGIY